MGTTVDYGSKRDGDDSPLVMHVRVVSGTGGGPDKTILNSPRFLKKLGYRCVCVYLRDPRDNGFAVIEERAVSRHAPLEAVDDFGIKDFGIVNRLRELMERYQPAIWHGHDYKSNLLGLMLRRRHPMQMVTTVHGWVQKTWKTPLFYFIDRQCLRRYDSVICVSKDLYEDCLKIGVAKSKLRQIDNAIALDDYDVPYSKTDAKRRLKVPEERQLVVAVGRLSQEKGFDLLIQAVSALIRQGLDVGLLIAGDGAERESLTQLIAGTGFSDRIQLLGFVDDPRLLYRAADVYALSSRREGLPNVVLEAMAMGIPVVATRVAGMPTLIEHNASGLLIPPEDIAALQSTLGELLSNETLARELGDAGRRTIADRFSFHQRMEKIVDAYKSVGVDPCFLSTGKQAGTSVSVQ